VLHFGAPTLQKAHHFFAILFYHVRVIYLSDITPNYAFLINNNKLGENKADAI